MLRTAASGEKIALGVSVLLAFSVFLLFAVDKLPENSSKLPIMGTVSETLCRKSPHF